MDQSPGYIKTLLHRNGGKTDNVLSRRVWGITLEDWVPFFMASNAMGETHIPSESLGAPVRLNVGKDGAIRFTQSGKPSLKVVDEVRGEVRLMQANFTFSLQQYAHRVATENEVEYNAQAEAATAAGNPIAQSETRKLTEAIELQQAQAAAEERKAARKSPRKSPKPEPDPVPAGATS